MPVIGTAGHIDHGKTTLIHALTGINPSRLPEEHARGMTIDLGYAHVLHPAGFRISFVDVPGHDGLVRNMVAGATGFELALWVVDAVEGMMPQSLEHLRIMELLGVAITVPVVTKADAATPAQRAATAGLVEQLLRRSNMASTPVHVVDSVSRRGIPDLLQTIFMLTAQRKRTGVADEPPYLPVDRVFTLKGVGTVITGTLLRGRLAVGAQVALTSQAGTVRVRTLSHHHAPAMAAEAGQRIGVNIAGLAADGVRRGDVLLGPGHPYHARVVNVQLRWLPGLGHDCRHGERMLFYTGCTEVECRIWDARSAGSSGSAQVELPQELSFHPAQRFVLRSGTPLTTVGGGEVVDLQPDRKRRVTEAERAAYTALADGTSFLERYLTERRVIACDLASLACRWMRPQGDLQREAERSSDLRVASDGPHGGTATVLWHAARAGEAHARMAALVRGAAERSLGFDRIGRALAVTPSCVPPLLAALLEDAHGDAHEDRDWRSAVRLERSGLTILPSHVAFTPEERRRATDLLARLRADGLRPANIDVYRRSYENQPHLTDRVLGKLRDSAQVVQVSSTLVLHCSAAEELRSAPARLDMDGIRAAEFGQRLGLSRRYGIPYLEYLNRQGIMRRDGDLHYRVSPAPDQRQAGGTQVTRIDGSPAVPRIPKA